MCTNLTGYVTADKNKEIKPSLQCNLLFLQECASLLIGAVCLFVLIIDIRILEPEQQLCRGWRIILVIAEGCKKDGWL